MIHDIHLVSDKARDGRASARKAGGDSARYPVALGKTGHIIDAPCCIDPVRRVAPLAGRVGESATPFNAARWQAEMDSEGLTARIRALRTAARAQGEPGLLAGVSLLLATMALLPFFAAVMG